MKAKPKQPAHTIKDFWTEAVIFALMKMAIEGDAPTGLINCSKDPSKYSWLWETWETYELKNYFGPKDDDFKMTRLVKTKMSFLALPSPFSMSHRLVCVLTVFILLFSVGGDTGHMSVELGANICL